MAYTIVRGPGIALPPRGPRGFTGDITPAVTALRDQVTTARDTVTSTIAAAVASATAATAADVITTAAARDAALAAVASNSIGTPQGRLSLVTGVPITASDIAGATTIYYMPFGAGNLVPVGGTMRAFAELAFQLDSNVGHAGCQGGNANFDLYVFSDSGTLRLGSGADWSTGATPGSNAAGSSVRGQGAGSTELQLANGVWTNKNSIAIRWGNASGNRTTVAANQATLVGGFRTTADGVTEDSASRRLLSDLYKAQPRPMLVTDSTDTWAGSGTGLFRQARASTANQVEYFHCMAGRMLRASVVAAVINSTSTRRAVNVGIGLSSTTVDSAKRRQLGFPDNTEVRFAEAFYSGYPGIGYHKVVWLEKDAGTDVQTWAGDFGAPAVYQSGLEAETLN